MGESPDKIVASLVFLKEDPILRLECMTLRMISI